MEKAITPMSTDKLKLSLCQCSKKMLSMHQIHFFPSIFISCEKLRKVIVTLTVVRSLQPSFYFFNFKGFLIVNYFCFVPEGSPHIVNGGSQKKVQQIKVELFSWTHRLQDMDFRWGQHKNSNNVFLKSYILTINC